MGQYGVILVGSLVAGLVLAGCSSDSGSGGRQTTADASASTVQLDGLRPSTSDGGEGCATAGCSEGNVCCAAPLPCAGKCLPDCRVSGSCPEQAPTCDQATGLCRGSKSDDPGTKPPMGDGPKPPLGDGGSKPPMGDGGLMPPQGDCTKDGCPMKDAVCCKSPLPCAGMCVPDCRLSSNTCPQQAPTCDQSTGLCK